MMINASALPTITEILDVNLKIETMNREIVSEKSVVNPNDANNEKREVVYIVILRISLRMCIVRINIELSESIYLD